MQDFKNKIEYLLKNEKLEFKPSQNKLSIPLIFRIFRKMESGLINFDAIKNGITLEALKNLLKNKIS